MPNCNEPGVGLRVAVRQAMWSRRLLTMTAGAKAVPRTSPIEHTWRAVPSIALRVNLPHRHCRHGVCSMAFVGLLHPLMDLLELARADSIAVRRSFDVRTELSRLGGRAGLPHLGSLDVRTECRTSRGLAGLPHVLDVRAD